MIAVSALLVVFAGVLLVSGSARGSELYQYASIVASAIAALALLVAVRRRPTGPGPDDDFDVPVRPPR